MVNTILRHTTPARPKRKQTQTVTNNAGGQVYKTSIWQQLHRFLIIGSEGGTYYVDEKKHTLDNVKCVDACIKEDVNEVLRAIVSISDEGRAPKNDYAIYVLAKVFAHRPSMNMAYTADRAEEAFHKIVRTGTHLFQFVAFVDSMRGWGSGLRRVVGSWYLNKSAQELAYQVLKYPSRHGWTHRDVLRKVHPKTNDQGLNTVLGYAVKGRESLTSAFDEIALIIARETAHMYDDPGITAGLIRDAGLSREMIPTAHMNDGRVQAALAKTMPYTALMRNLGNLSRHNVLDADVVQRLTDEGYIKKSRVHPLNILTALKTYKQGYGFRGSHSWPVNRAVVRALDDAFHKSFQYAQPTGQRILMGLDVSGSMSGTINNGILTAAEVAAALAMYFLRTEDWMKVMGFCHSFVDLGLSPSDSLTQALRKTSRHNFGSTDCSLPMQYALDNNLKVDLFIVVTDNETWGDRWGRSTPAEKLKEYRQKTGINAKMVVLATDSNGFSIADPNDPGMLDIAGFDTAVPDIISAFARL